MEILGAPRVRLLLESDGPVAQVVVPLNDVPPESGPGPAHRSLRAARYVRRVVRDLADGRTTYREASEGSGFDGVGMARIEAIALEVGQVLERSYRVHPRDPSAMGAEVDQEIRLRRTGWEVSVASRVTMSCDAERFVLDAELRGSLDGRDVAVRRWSPTVRRELV